MRKELVTPAPALSIVVPTHDRAASVFRLLRAVHAQVGVDSGLTPEELEVIVVSDGSTDGTLDRLRESVTNREWPFALHIVEHPSPRGPGIARNSGAAQARGQVLLFIDDDIEPFDGALAMHRRMHTAAAARGDLLIVIGAPVPVRDAAASLQQIAAWGWWEQQFERMSRPGHRFTYDEVFTGVLSVPRAAFESVGRFDSTLGGCHEDSELGLRLFHAGARAAFSREAGGVHHEVRDIARLLPRKRDEGIADVRLLQRWPELTASVRVTDRLPPSRSLFGLLRRSAMSGGWHADAVPRVTLPMLRWLDRRRMRHSWRLVHGALLTHCYWRGVAGELGSHEAVQLLQSQCADDLAVWQASARHAHIDLADGLESAERKLDALRPDHVTVHVGDEEVGEVRAVPGAERLHGGHLRNLLATTLAQPAQVALALREVRSAAQLT
ncbi:MAG TPA: glycosyltransferase family A protein, partial [Gemmatimonadaceae bacterium]|nr:glycosyltransferase family A protein [Gemmatimonadaceae bacterium]